jgi:putative oxidoreductase
MGSLQKFQAAFYFVLRFVFGAMFALHGAQKLFGFPIDAPIKIERFGQLWFGGVIELACGVLIAVGLFTRFAAILASGTMAVAYFQFHKGYEFDGFKWMPMINGGEAAVMYCLAFLYIAAHGPGRVAVDRS